MEKELANKKSAEVLDRTHSAVRNKALALVIIAPIVANTITGPVAYAHEGSLIKAVYEDYSYDDIREKYDELEPKIKNEQTIIDGKDYTKYQKNVAKSTKEILEKKKSVLNELLIIKDENTTEEEKKNAENTLHDMESKPFIKAWELAKKLGYKGMALFNYVISKIASK